MTVAEILEENRKRNAALYAEYDPLSGIGSLIPRFEFKIDQERTMLLPDSMKDHVEHLNAGGKTMKRIMGSKFEEGWDEFILLRIKYDFEFWAATCAHIEDKVTKEIKLFKLRYPQRVLLAVLIRLFWAGEPIRVILLKARQWGGSTLIQLFMAWLQMFHFKNWHSAIVGDVENQARTIRGMYTRMATLHPEHIQKVTFNPYEGSSKNRIMLERGCIVSIGSMQQPENLRSTDIMMAHKSEVGSWKETIGKKPEDLIMALSGIPMVAGSLDIEESTAKGVGNYFHNAWLKAVRGESGREPVFIPWFYIDMYQRPFYNQTEKRKFVETWDDYQKFLWEEGATIEGISWYYWKRNHEGWGDPSDHWRMMAEFPTTPTEAFQSTGRRAFSPIYVKKSSKYVTPPEFIGEVFADGTSGKEAFRNIRFDQVAGGGLSIWIMPDLSVKYKNRFVVGVDIGGRSKGADYSIIRVLDRLPLLTGGKPEFVLTWRGHLDQDLVVWKAAQIGYAYGNGLLVPETNSLDKKESEGDHFLTVLNEIVNYYENIYTRTSIEKIRQGAPVQYGFHTGSNKTAMIDNMNKLLRTMGFIDYDQRAVNEWDSYEIKPNGTYGAVDGQHDDILMCSAICLTVSAEMELPVEIKVSHSKPRSRVIISEASM